VAAAAEWRRWAVSPVMAVAADAVATERSANLSLPGPNTQIWFVLMHTRQFSHPPTPPTGRRRRPPGCFRGAVKMFPTARPHPSARMRGVASTQAHALPPRVAAIEKARRPKKRAPAPKEKEARTRSQSEKKRAPALVRRASMPCHPLATIVVAERAGSCPARPEHTCRCLAQVAARRPRPGPAALTPAADPRLHRSRPATARPPPPACAHVACAAIARGTRRRVADRARAAAQAGGV